MCYAEQNRGPENGPERSGRPCISEYESPLGRLTLAGEERALTGLWLEGQKYFGATLVLGSPRRDDLACFVLARDWLDRFDLTGME